MKITKAYRCEYCNTIKDAERNVMSGVIYTEDLFDKEKSFPSTDNLDNTKIHFCFDCYRENVILPAMNRADRKKDEPGYRALIATFSFIFRKEVIRRFSLPDRK
jgi:hypothetical protein